MKKIFIAVITLGIVSLTFSALEAMRHDEGQRVYGGKSPTPIIIGPETSSVEDLIKRVRLLEQAVNELQQKCSISYQEPNFHNRHRETWTCKIMTRKDFIYGSGETRGEAEKNGMEKCSQAQGEGAFCKVDNCSKE